MPEGAWANFFLYRMHNDERYFPNPDQFLPERFEKMENIVKFSFIPFSAGPRNCIGWWLMFFIFYLTSTSGLRAVNYYYADIVLLSLFTYLFIFFGLCRSEICYAGDESCYFSFDTKIPISTARERADSSYRDRNSFTVVEQDSRPFDSSRT